MTSRNARLKLVKESRGGKVESAAVASPYGWRSCTSSSVLMKLQRPSCSVPGDSGGAWLKQADPCASSSHQKLLSKAWGEEALLIRSRARVRPEVLCRARGRRRALDSLLHGTPRHKPRALGQARRFANGEAPTLPTRNRSSPLTAPLSRSAAPSPPARTCEENDAQSETTMPTTRFWTVSPSDPTDTMLIKAMVNTGCRQPPGTAGDYFALSAVTMHSNSRK